MRRFISPAVGLALAPMLFACGESPGDELEGAWQTVQIAYTSADTSWTNSNPPPGLYIFSEGHYSTMYLVGQQPRPLYADGNWPASAPPTAEEKVMQYDSFIANSGSFETANGALTARPMVAKNPNFMAKGTWSADYELGEDTLVLTFRDDNGGETRTTFRKLE